MDSESNAKEKEKLFLLQIFNFFVLYEPNVSQSALYDVILKYKKKKCEDKMNKI